LKKINDPNRIKVPEKLRQSQDEQMEKFLKEEKILLEAVEKIKALK